MHGELRNDHQGLKGLLQARTLQSDFEVLKNDLNRVASESADRGRELERDMNTMVTSCGQQIESCQKEMLLKASLKDLCALLDQKVSLGDVNKALGQVEGELSKFVTSDRLKEITEDQALVTEALCAENCVARWVWKSGDVLQGAQVPWEV